MIQKLIVSLAIMLAVFSTPAQTPQVPKAPGTPGTATKTIPCGDAKRIASNLYGEYGEITMWVGSDVTDNTIVYYMSSNSKTGSWTMVIQFNSDIACIVATGFNATLLGKSI